MLAPDTILQNRYRIVRQLGEGGMGAVFEAVDQRLDTTVALKKTLFADERLGKQFEREARLLARLHHPALPRVSDHFSDDNGQFLVMQFIAGDDLSEMMSKRHDPFPVEQVLTWTDQLLDALDYLHTQDPQIIHRDIKPQNLKLTARGQIILLDFGLAKGQVGELSRVTTSASIFGYTPNYAPLEQIQGLGTDARSDIYSLAATVYHLITGMKPPDALSRAASVVNGEPDPLQNASEVNGDVPAHVSEVLHRAMAQNREHRYQSAAEMRRALDGADSKVTATARTEAATVLFPSKTRAATVAEAPAQKTVAKQPTVRGGETTIVRSPPPKQGIQKGLLAVGALIVICLGVGSFFLFQGESNPTPTSESLATPEPTPTVESAPSPQTQALQTPIEPRKTEEKRAAAEADTASRAERGNRPAEEEKRSSSNTRQETETQVEKGETRVMAPNEVEVPEPDVPPNPDYPRARRAPVIRTLPDGTQIISAPDGSRVIISPDGRRRVIRRGTRPNRNRYP